VEKKSFFLVRDHIGVALLVWHMTMDSPSHMGKNNEAYLNLEIRVFHRLLAILNTKFCCGITLLHPCTSSYKNCGKKFIESIRKMFFLRNGK
jgi:hypothetical protein